MKQSFQRQIADILYDSDKDSVIKDRSCLSVKVASSVKKTILFASL